KDAFSRRIRFDESNEHTRVRLTSRGLDFSAAGLPIRRGLRSGPRQILIIGVDALDRLSLFFLGESTARSAKQGFSIPHANAESSMATASNTATATARRFA